MNFPKSNKENISKLLICLSKEKKFNNILRARKFLLLEIVKYLI